MRYAALLIAVALSASDLRSLLLSPLGRAAISAAAPTGRFIFSEAICTR